MDLVNEFIENYLNQYCKNPVKKPKLSIFYKTHMRNTPTTDGATINKYELTMDPWF